MNPQTLQTLLGWCTVINAGLMIIFSLMLLVAGNWVYRLHGKWFPMPRETFNAILYSFLGVYKLLLIVFNLVPYVALVIIN